MFDKWIEFRSSLFARAIITRLVQSTEQTWPPSLKASFLFSFCSSLLGEDEIE